MLKERPILLTKFLLQNLDIFVRGQELLVYFASLHVADGKNAWNFLTIGEETCKNSQKFIYLCFYTYHNRSVNTFLPLKLYIRGACEKKPPCPLKIPFHELKRTSPRVFTTGSSWSLDRTIESRFCTLKLPKEKNIILQNKYTKRSLLTS